MGGGVKNIPSPGVEQREETEPSIPAVPGEVALPSPGRWHQQRGLEGTFSLPAVLEIRRILPPPPLELGVELNQRWLETCV